jgi:hypothetical protein
MRRELTSLVLVHFVELRQKASSDQDSGEDTSCGSDSGASVGLCCTSAEDPGGFDSSSEDEGDDGDGDGVGG